jgi:hypothetical protein
MTASHLDAADATVEIFPCDDPTCQSPDLHERGLPARVTITYPYELGLVRILLGWALQDGHVDINTTFVMRNE